MAGANDDWSFLWAIISTKAYLTAADAFFEFVHKTVTHDFISII